MVTEFWYESDVPKNSKSHLTCLDELNYSYKYAEVRNHAERTMYQTDFSGLLLSCYSGGLAEKKQARRRPLGYVGTVGNNGEITIGAVCRIKYRPESSTEPKPDDKK